MAELFNRFLSITAGASGGEAVKINGLQAVFSVEKSNDATKNSCNLSIYNMSETTVSKFEAGAAVTITAGYITNADMIFSGTITEARTRREGPHKITEIQARDGFTEINKTLVSVSYKSGSKAKMIIRDISGRFGIPVRLFDNLSGVEDREFSNGFSFAGFAIDLIAIIAEYLQVEFSIQNREIIFRKAGTGDDTGVILRPETGLIGSPERIKKASEKEGVEKSGYKVSSLMIPRIVPGGIVGTVINGKDVFYRCERVIHSGDYFGNDWKTTAEVF